MDNLEYIVAAHEINNFEIFTQVNTLKDGVF
jgi:hypothetical protein